MTMEEEGSNGHQYNDEEEESYYDDDDDLEETVLNDLSNHTLSTHDDLLGTEIAGGSGLSTTSNSSSSSSSGNHSPSSKKSGGEGTARTAETTGSGSPKLSPSAMPSSRSMMGKEGGDPFIDDEEDEAYDSYDDDLDGGGMWYKSPSMYGGMMDDDGTDYTPTSNSNLSGSTSSKTTSKTRRKKRNANSSSGIGNEKYNHTISMVRLMFITTLFTFAAIVSNVVFIISHNKEQSIFQEKLHLYGKQFQNEIQTTLYKYYWFADSFVSSITASDDSASTTTSSITGAFPSSTSSSSAMTIPDFVYQCEQIHALLQTSVIWYSPILYGKHDRQNFEYYAILQQTNPTLYDVSIASSSTSSSNSRTNHSHTWAYHESTTSPTQVTFYDTDRTISQGIYRMENGKAVRIASSGDDDDEVDVSLAVPIWQISTVGGNDVVENAYSIRMFDQYSERIRQDAIQQMLNIKDGSDPPGAAVLSDILSSSNKGEEGDDNDDSIHESFQTPTSAWYFPITTTSSSSGSESTAKVVTGAMTFHLHWQTIIEQTIPKLGLIENESHGPIMFLVLENTCGSIHSYGIDLHRKHSDSSGEDGSSHVTVTYLGDSDTYHDDTLEAPYFDYEDVTNFVIIQNPATRSEEVIEGYSDIEDVATTRSMDSGGNEDSSPYFIPITSTCGSYRIRLYPTVEMKATYITSRPELLRTGIAMLFLFTCCIFIGYDCIQERKNRQLQSSAQRTNAIVESLFPSTVRDRIYEEQVLNQPPVNPKVLRASLTKMQNPKYRLKSYLDGDEEEHNNSSHHRRKSTTSRGRGKSSMKKAYYTGNNGGNAIMEDVKSAMYNEAQSRLSKSYSQKAIMDAINDIKELEKYMPTSDPIADLFPRATVMSADIAGFTAWSSEREPSQVFTLLESMFGVMDKAAQKLKVFKVETIGDCYVAATGLPEAQPDHAVRMARFASTCLNRVTALVESLEATLGPGTGNLSLRFGIHSGPVTAGVLRGEKSRFQLFGDTLDLASKMESSGIRGRIQLSQDTAELLVQSGKSHWIRPRRHRDMTNSDASSVASTMTPSGEFSIISSASSITKPPSFKVLHKGKPISTFWLDIDGSSKTMMLSMRRRQTGYVRERRAASVSQPLQPLSSTDMSIDSRSLTSGDGLVDEVTGWADAQIVEPGNPIKANAEKKQLERLIDWNVEELLSILRRVVARRNAIKKQKRRISDSISFESPGSSHSKKGTIKRKGSSSSSASPASPVKKTMDRMSISFDSNAAARRGSNTSLDSRGASKPKSWKRKSSRSNGTVTTLPINEIQEVVQLAEFDPSLPGLKASDAAVKLGQEVQQELRDYVSQIAAGYLENSFHNFEHASHVCLSSNKLLKRIVQSDAVDYAMTSKGRTIADVASDLHHHTYGISSDPLAHFAIVFSALIHDVGHTGVPNNQLANEHPEMAIKYQNQSIAEQRSVDIAWELLMAPCYTNLRKCIFSNDEERTQFRQLVVNTVLATDIFDKRIGEIRKARWDKAFNNDDSFQSLDKGSSSYENDMMNRKATIVIEHIIQASDVSHTMQHWHIYQRWNERLFQEMYKAYTTGRSMKNPADGWYQGELWFFDSYVIPLAHKLKDCGVFGVSCDEYLNYALANREEWERKGHTVVANMVTKVVQQQQQQQS